MGGLSLHPGDLPNSEFEPRSPALQADSLPAEPQGKPKNTGVGSLSPSPADLPDPGIELESPALQADSLPTELCPYLTDGKSEVLRDEVICPEVEPEFEPLSYHSWRRQWHPTPVLLPGKFHGRGAW